MCHAPATAAKCLVTQWRVNLELYRRCTYLVGKGKGIVPGIKSCRHCERRLAGPGSGIHGPARDLALLVAEGQFAFLLPEELALKGYCISGLPAVRDHGEN